MSSGGPDLDEILFDDIRDALQPGCDTPTPDVCSFPTIDNYEIVREIHRGGQGIVFEAVQRNPERKVALKVLLRGSFSSVAERQRFEREVRWISSVTHPNIVTIYDSGFVDGQPFYTMELVDGTTLNSDLRFQRPQESSAGIAREHIIRCIRLVIQICEAVSCFQRRGLIHRDQTGKHSAGQ